MFNVILRREARSAEPRRMGSSGPSRLALAREHLRVTEALSKRERLSMSRLTRRKFLATTAAAGSGLASFGILTSRTRAAEFTYKYANNVPVTHPMNVRAREAVEKIKEESGGRLEIQIFPNNQLGGDTDMLSQVRSGAIEFFTLSGLILSTLVPVASINGIGFGFLANAAAWAKLPKDLQEIVARNLNAAALKDREDIRKLNESLQGQLTQKGMMFNNTDAELFRAALRKAGFYAEWKQKFGADAWALLER